MLARRHSPARITTPVFSLEKVAHGGPDRSRRMTCVRLLSEIKSDEIWAQHLRHNEAFSAERMRASLTRRSAFRSAKQQREVHLEESP